MGDESTNSGGIAAFVVGMTGLMMTTAAWSELNSALKWIFGPTAGVIIFSAVFFWFADRRMDGIAGSDSGYTKTERTRIITNERGEREEVGVPTTTTNMVRWGMGWLVSLGIMLTAAGLPPWPITIFTPTSRPSGSPSTTRSIRCNEERPLWSSLNAARGS